MQSVLVVRSTALSSRCLGAIYSRRVTAKESLLERVRDLSDEEAEEWLARLEWESTEADTLGPEEFEDAEAGRREFEAGDFVLWDDLKRKLAL